MLRKLRSRLTFANVASALALFVALSTGGAYAAGTIDSEDVIDDSLLSVDIKNGQVRGVDLGSNSVNSGKVIDNSLHSVDVHNGTLAPDDLKRGAAARGNGVLTQACISDSNCTLERNHSVTSITRLETGTYCIKVAGADPATDTIVAGLENTIHKDAAVAVINRLEARPCQSDDFVVLTGAGSELSNGVPFWFAVL
jgi:hypothetical protein